MTDSSHTPPLQRLQAFSPPGDLYRLLFEEAADAMFMTDPHGRMIAVNARACALSGYTPDELTGMHLSGLIPPEDLARDPIPMEALEQGRSVRKERRLLCKDGTSVWVENRVRMLPEGNILGITIDISERRQAEATAQRQAQELGAVHALSDAISASLSLEQVAEAALQGMRDATGADMAFLFLREGERLILHDLLPPEQRSRLGAVDEHRVGECICGLAVRDGRSLYSVDIHVDTRCTWQECKRAGISSFAALPLKSGEGVIGVIGLASLARQDFSSQANFLETLARQATMALANARLYATAQRELAERKLMEEELRNKERMLSSVFRSAPTGIGVVVNRKLMMVNDKVCEILGYHQEELIGQSARMLYPDEADFLYVGKEKYRQISEQGTGTVETRWRRKDGRIIDILMSSTPINPFDLTAGVTFSALDITKRRRAEEALRESQELFSRAFSLSPAPMVISDPDTGCFIDANEQWLRMLGHTREETIGHTSYELNIWEDPAIRTAMGKKITTDGFLREEPIRFRTKSGEFKDTLWSAVLVALSGNKVMLSLIYDFTERKQAEEALRFTQFAIDNAADQVFWIDEGARFTYVNDQACRTLGYSREELLRMTVYDIDPSHTPEHRRDFRRRLGEQRSLIFETVHRNRDGQIYPVEIRSNYVEYGGQTYNCAFVQDISERKRAEATLRAKTEELDQFFSVSLELLCIATTDGFIVRLNPQWQQVLGYSLAELKQVRFLDFVHPDDQEATLQAMSQLSAQQPVLRFVNRYRCKDGSYRWIEWSSTPSGHLVYAAARDITERRQIEQDLQESHRMLRDVLEHIPVRVFWKDLESRYLGCNRLFARDAGFASTESLVGLDDLNLPWIKQAQKYLADDRWVIESGKPMLNFEELQTMPEGHQLWLRTSKVPLRNSTGAIYGVLGAYEDITEHKGILEALTESTNNFTQLFQSAPVPIAFASEADNWEIIRNEAWYQTFGYVLAQRE